MKSKLLTIKIATPRRRYATDVKFKPQEESAVICKLLAFQRIQIKQALVATPTMCLNEEIGIAARVGRDPMTVSRIWNRWVQDGNTECRAGS
ncbi:uncharacterized protein TNCV_439491 [Trichonephila clavipes]|nr:uncharacterized protein TNCV_439491 [Trichonephila clavipes]